MLGALVHSAFSRCALLLLSALRMLGVVRAQVPAVDVAGTDLATPAVSGHVETGDGEWQITLADPLENASELKSRESRWVVFLSCHGPLAARTVQTRAQCMHEARTHVRGVRFVKFGRDELLMMHFTHADTPSSSASRTELKRCEARSAVLVQFLSKLCWCDHIAHASSSDQAVRLFWLDYSGKQVRYKTIEVGRSHRQQVSSR